MVLKLKWNVKLKLIKKSDTIMIKRIVECWEKDQNYDEKDENYDNNNN